jgi:hypothetical protein
MTLRQLHTAIVVWLDRSERGQELDQIESKQRLEVYLSFGVIRRKCTDLIKGRSIARSHTGAVISCECP